MIAKVQYKGKIYYSYVFAHFMNCYRNYYVVYDSIGNNFEIISLFEDDNYGHRQIGLIDENEEYFIDQNDIELTFGKANALRGYPWLINEVEHLKNIDLKAKIPSSITNKAKEMNSTINPDKWNEVLNYKDVKNMTKHTGNFHDNYLVELKANANYIDFTIPAKLQIRFTSQGPFDILVEFEDGIYIKSGFFSCNRIYTSTIVIGKEYIYWVYDAEEGLLEDEIDKYQYIQAKKLRWKFINKNENDW